MFLQDHKALIKLHFPLGLFLFALLREVPWHVPDKTERLTKCRIRAQVDSSGKYTKPATKLCFGKEFEMLLNCCLVLSACVYSKQKPKIFTLLKQAVEVVKFQTFSLRPKSHKCISTGHNPDYANFFFLKFSAVKNNSI